VCGGALLLMISSALFLVHCSAVLLMFNRALLILVLSADTLVAYRTLLHIQSIAHLFHLGLADFLLLSAALLFIRSTALFLVRCLRLILGVTVPVDLLRNVGSIYRDG